MPSGGLTFLESPLGLLVRGAGGHASFVTYDVSLLCYLEGGRVLLRRQAVFRDPLSAVAVAQRWKGLRVPPAWRGPGGLETPVLEALCDGAYQGALGGPILRLQCIGVVAFRSYWKGDVAADAAAGLLAIARVVPAAQIVVRRQALSWLRRARSSIADVEVSALQPL